MIVKLPTANPANIQVGLALRLYRARAALLRARSLLPCRSTCRGGSAQRPIRSGPSFVLVLEDIDDLVVGDQVRGVSVHQAEVAVDALAALHARWWERPRLRAGLAPDHRRAHVPGHGA